MTVKSKADLLADIATNLANASNITAAELRSTFTDLIDSLYPAAREPWEDVGGSVPTLGALNIGGGAVPADLGTGSVVLSKFGRIGSECFGTVRIHAGTGATGVTGAWTITGLPVDALMVGAGADGGQNIGYGFMLDGGDGKRKYPVTLVVDPGLPGAPSPVLFVDYESGTADGVDVLIPVDFTFGGDDILCRDSSPFEFADDSIINLVLAYEGDV